MFAQSIPLILTLLAIGGGIILNNKGLADLKADVKDMKTELKGDIARVESRIDRVENRIDALKAHMDTRLDAIHSEQMHFSELKGHLEGRVDEIARLVSERIPA